MKLAGILWRGVRGGVGSPIVESERSHSDVNSEDYYSVTLWSPIRVPYEDCPFSHLSCLRLPSTWPVVEPSGYLDPPDDEESG